METFSFSVRGSAAQPYRVTFEVGEDRVRAFCNCPAGAKGQPCKHRLALLLSEPAPDDAEALIALRRAFAGSPLERALHALARRQTELDIAKDAVDEARAEVATAMRGG